MAKQTASTKQTSGGGFGFEDKVGAHFAVWMLLGGVPFYPRLGRISKIEFQKRVDGYQLDDLVLTIDHDGNSWECSLSVKSNTQFSAKKAPESFVLALWETYLHVGRSRFVRNRDWMGLVTASLPEPLRGALLVDLLPKARHQEPQKLASRLTSTDQDAKRYTSETVRDLFKSFKCPPNLQTSVATGDAATADVLKHTVVMDFNFGEEPSSDEAHAIQLLGRILRDDKDAVAAWQDLLAIVRRESEAGGYLDRAKLLGELKAKHEFAAFPDFAADWQKLTEWGRETLNGITDMIGGKLQLPRTAVVESVNVGLQSSKLCGVVGTSGSGKSVLTKRAALALSAAGGPILWFGAEEFASPNFAALGSRLGMSHSLTETFANLSERSGIVVLDGLERLSADTEYAQIKRLFAALAVGKHTSSWLVIFSCQSERWEGVQANLIRIGIDVHALAVVQVLGLSSEDIQAVATAFPNLNQVLYRSHLRQLISRPKVVDILAAHSVLMGEAEPGAWAGESDFVDWYWTSVVSASDSGPSRSALVQSLSERQADHGESETPITEIQQLPLDAISSLERDGICHRTARERVTFDHDLIADWCRQRLILSKDRDLPAYLSERVFNPVWHRSIRLYGLHLLEGTGGLEAWEAARAKLPFAEDLLLDSVVLTANSRELLTKLWPTLIREKGQLLRRLLRRFHHVATYPDPVAVWLGEHSKNDRDIAGWLRANMRRPLWPYWVGILPFLREHLAEVVSLAPLEVALITQTWLLRGHAEWILRKEAAELALAVGEATWQERLAQPYRKDDDDQKKYQAALAAASELPDEVADLTLRGCARKLTPQIESGEAAEYSAPGTMVDVYAGFSLSVKRVQPEPWEHGPKHRIDSAFQECCLFRAALLPLMTARPNVAAEVILATIIDHRTPERPDHSMHSLREDVHLCFLPKFIRPLYDKGPFQSFLIAAPDAAIDCIISLVDFATERFMEAREEERSFEPFAIIDGEKVQTFRGDGQVCGWYRGASPHNALSSALMALERWLYDQTDNGQSVEHHCSQILAKAKSCAFLGLLWEVGRYKAALFKGALRPLLPCSALYWWETEALRQGINALGLIGLQLESESGREKITKWEGMPHRNGSVERFAIRLSLFDDSTKKFFGAAKRRWQKERELHSALPFYVHHLDELLAQFDRANWEDATDSEGNRFLKYRRTPAQEQRAKEASEELQEIAPFFLITQARKLLNEGSALDAEKLQQLFAALQELKQRKANDKNDERRLLTAIMGGIAVLAYRHWEWLETDKERKSWCRSTLLEILRDPPRETEFASEYDRSCLSWEDFTAQALVPFWADTPHDADIRHAIAEAAMARRYSAVMFLTHAAYERRAKLGDEFNRLIRFVFDWAIARHDINWQRRHDEPVEMDTWYATHGENFIRGTTPTEWGSWAEQSIRDGRTIDVGGPRSVMNKKPPKKRFAIRPRIDQLLLSAAFGSILRITEATKQERAGWLKFWRDVTNCFLSAHTVCDEGGKRVTDADSEAYEIYDSDRWLGRRLSELILDMDASEKPAQVWESVFGLGPPGHEWIETFLWEWLAHGLLLQQRATFVTAWKAMFAYAESSAIWTDPKNAWPHWDDFWTNLLGFDQHIVSLWQGEDHTVILEMIECYARWVPQNLSDRWIARAFLIFLNTPAAHPLRISAVPWILAAAKSADDYWWDSGERTDQIADVLDKLWRAAAEAIAKNQALRTDFRELVAILSHRQHPLAMDLQERLATLKP